ncbi:hypothetical protein, partial [Fulvivirga kasyanovii]
TAIGLKSRLGIIEEYSRLYDALLDILVGAGYLELSEGTLQTSKRVSVQSLSRLSEEHTSLSGTHSSLSSYAALVWQCVTHYPDILTGK